MTRAARIVLCLVCVNACAEDAPPPRVQGADVHLAPDTTEIRGLVADDSTMDSMLRVNGLSASVVQEVIAAARAVFDPRKLRTRQPFLLERTLDGALRLFEYRDRRRLVPPDCARRLILPTARARKCCRYPRRREQVTRSGAIDETTPSLFQSIDAAGEGADLAVAMAEVFAGEIDFNSDLQPGDRYSLSFERFTREGRPASYGGDHRRPVRERRASPARDSFHDARRQARLLRREGPIAAPVLSQVATEVRAAGDLGLLSKAHASGAAHGAGASRRGLRGSAGRAGHRRCRWPRCLRDVR